jgi:hypothetical protein
MNVTASIPEGLALHVGDELQLQALVQADGSFLVTRVLHRENLKLTRHENRPSLSDWVKKWGGKFKLPEGKDLDDVRRDAVLKKHSF